MLKCLICDKEFNQLESHLRNKHNISAKEYCNLYKIKSVLSEESINNISNKTKEAMKSNVVKEKQKNAWTKERKETMSKLMKTIHTGKSPTNKLTTSQYQQKLNDKFPNKFLVLSDYISTDKPIKVKCLVCNTIFTSSRASTLLLRGRCPSCTKINKKKRVNTWNKISNEDFKDNFYKLVGDEYTLLSDYIDAAHYIKVRHNICNYTWDVRARQFTSPSTLSRCPLCAKSMSNQEVSLANWIKSIYNKEVIERDRKQIHPQELDIYIPDCNLAIEFNGTYWHSALQKDKNYHYNKSRLCEEKGIRLIHIWEYEWNNERQRPILQNIIKNALGINENKIYARKLDIEVRESKSMKDFFNQNNIQGFRGGKFAICLIDKETKECYMSYIIGKAYFGKGKYEYEVIRGATKLGYTIVGGASKIWSYFIKHYNPKSVVYYIDYNYFNGNSLPYLGLKYVKTQFSFKNYFVETGQIKNRDPLHHKEIKELEEQGLVIPIYNAGTKVYVWERE